MLGDKDKLVKLIEPCHRAAGQQTTNENLLSLNRFPGTDSEGQGAE